jgi:O-acetyl-ADP-ribose deacetylase (regulator of RNase III)
MRTELTSDLVAAATPMTIIPGDLLRLALDGRFDVIVHGCDCQCQMGKGIAVCVA